MKKNNKLSIFLTLFLIIVIAYPILGMIINIDWNDFGSLIKSNSFKEALSNSVYITFLSAIVSLLLAYFLSYTLNRTNIKHRAVLKVLLTVPMLSPSIAHGLGLINLFGANGLISKMFGFNIIGPTGVLLGSIMYAYPVAFLILDDGFNYIDNNMYNLAKVLGLNKWQTFNTVTFTYLKKPILSAFFATFTMIFTDYGVPLSVGGKFLTLPVFLYKEVIGLLDLSRGTIIGLFLLIPAVISLLFDMFSKDYSNTEYTNQDYKISSTKIKDTIFGILTYLIIICIMIILSSFVYYAFIDNPVLNKELSLTHFNTILNDNIIRLVLNSLIISVFTSIIGTIIAYLGAYITARSENKLKNIIHVLIISSLAIPGIVLGLSYSISFSGTLVYNTYLIIVVVNIVHFIASPYLMAYNALKKVNPNYETVGKTFNISDARILLDVIVPCTKKTLREMISYFFINSMITISAVTFLYTTRTMPVSLMINTYEGSLMLGEAAIISLIILIINLILKTTIYLINRKERIKSYAINK